MTRAVQPRAGDPAITPELVDEHGISRDEYRLILGILGREPTFTELGVFSAMWSEHCGYKNSKPLLRTLPTKAPWVLQGPGENAGVIDVGDGLAVAFKIESHNHPSAVEPYQGAATGVGGILRDVFTMGARPIAVLNSLRFGELDGEEAARVRYLFAGVVKGIGDYGNCVGIPTVGGEVYFDARLRGEPAGERDGHRAHEDGGADQRVSRRAWATRSWPSAPGPAATGSTAPPSPPRSCPRRARRSGRWCRWATPSPRSCCSRHRWS